MECDSPKYSLLVLFLFVALMLLFLSAVEIYYCEHDAQPETFASVFHNLWWSVANLTTVGYSDVYSATTGGKIFAFVVLLVGLIVVINGFGKRHGMSNYLV